MNPNGLRVGTPAMTSRGLMEEDFVKIGQYLVDHLGQVLRETIPGWQLPYGYLIKKPGELTIKYHKMMGIDCDEVSFSELDDYHFYLAGCKSLTGVSIFNHIWDDDPY